MKQHLGDLAAFNLHDVSNQCDLSARGVSSGYYPASFIVTCMLAAEIFIDMLINNPC